jgi:hypothetical protein
MFSEVAFFNVFVVRPPILELFSQMFVQAESTYPQDCPLLLQVLSVYRKEL